MVSIATFCRGQATNSFIEAARENDIEVDVIRERSRFDFSSLRQMREIVRARRPDIVQTHGVKSHFLMRFSGLPRHLPWIGFHHGYTAEDVKMRVYNRLDRLSLPAASGVVTVCLPFADELRRNGVSLSKITVLPNAIDTVEAPGAGEVGELRSRPGILPSEKILLSIGRFSAEKAQMDLIHGAALLHKTNPALPFRLVLCGDGPERVRLIEAISSLGLTDKCILPGYQGNVAPFYGLADIFVLPSHSEGSPNVLLEAMAYGVPIVATEWEEFPKWWSMGLPLCLCRLAIRKL